MTELVLKLPKLHIAQKQILKNQKRFNTIDCGRRWGKSHLAADLLLDAPKAALEGFPVAYCAPTYKLLDETFRNLRKLVSPISSRIDGSQHRIELITGGSIECWTLQDSDAGRSRKYTHVVVDEAAHVDNFEEIWTKGLRATLSDYQGQGWFLSTPAGFNFFKTLFDRGDPNSKFYDTNYASWQMPTSTNPFISEQEIESARKDLPELAFRQEYLAEFISIQGALLRPSYFKAGEPVGGTTVVGVDLAISTKESADYTAIVVLTKTEEALYVREVTRFRGTFNEIITEIIRVCKKWNPSIVGVERVQFQAAVIQELLRTTQLNVIGIVPEKDKVTRFQPLVARYEQGLIYHAPNLITEFEKELLVFPVGRDSPDMVDAMSVAFKALNHSKPMVSTLLIPSL